LPHPADAIQIEKVSGQHRDAAVDLLARFFREEDFATPRHLIAQNLDQMLADETCWVAVALALGRPSGVITVTTMRYVEWGRLAEIGDLYIVPAHRGRGLARKLVDAAVVWSQQRGCAGIYVTVTPEGEARHRLSRFYERLDFEPTGRTTMRLAGFVRSPESV
jgi:GNAT superfamily N-acetyltransferase